MTELTDANLDPTRLPDEAFELLWDKVQGRWNDDKVHAAFLEYARERLLLPEAGARYRAVKDSEPERAEVAKKKLGLLMVLALTLLERAREERARRARAKSPPATRRNGSTRLRTQWPRFFWPC